MKAHKKTKLFRHFMTILNMLALAVPMVVLGFHALNDSLPKFFASQSVQHHGGESDVFSDDLDYANEQLKTRSLDDNLMLTMDSMNYMNYGVQNNPTIIEYQYDTNEVNSLSDLVNGNIYLFRFPVPSVSTTYNAVNISTRTGTLVSPFYPYFSSGRVVYRNIVTSDTSGFLYSFDNSNSAIYSFGTRIGFVDFNYIDFPFIVNDVTDINYNVSVYQILECPRQFIPYTITSSPSTDVTSLDDWKTFYNNKNYAQIIDTGVSTHLPINVDFVSLFTQSDIINHDGNIATLLFINFYCNWILNISLIIFFPQVIMCFINWAIDLIYKFTEVKGD